MEERVSCKNCGSSILPQTAELTSGVCKPCYNQDLQDTIAETPFGRAYETSFDQPKFYSKNDYDWEWFDIWRYMEYHLSGLMFSIRCSGHCDWVFRDRSADALKLRDAEHFKEQCLAHLEYARSEAHKLRAKTTEELTDRMTILRKADEMQRTVELAYEMLKKREIVKTETDG